MESAESAIQPEGERMNRKSLTGAVLAVAVGAMFLTTPIIAQESSGNSSQANVKCVGGNSCKGQSACKGGNHSCKGLNACKGQGFVTTASAQECTDKGGHPAEARN
jgi:hypothetical protein